MLGRLVSRVASLETALAQAQMQRRKLHNELIELRGNVRTSDYRAVCVSCALLASPECFPCHPLQSVYGTPGTSLCLRIQIRVFCRVRPSAAASAVKHGSDAVSLQLTSEDGKDHGFTFDHVFGPAASQAEVFAVVADVVQSALDGYNVCPLYRRCDRQSCLTAGTLCGNTNPVAQVCLFSYGQTGAGKTHTMQGGSGTQQGIIPRSVHKVQRNVSATCIAACAVSA